MSEREVREVLTVTLAAQRSGLAPSSVRRYIRRGLVQRPLTEADLITLRRIRRLTDLGLNLAGVEVVVRMRQLIEELQAEETRLRALLDL